MDDLGVLPPLFLGWHPYGGDLATEVVHVKTCLKILPVPTPRDAVAVEASWKPGRPGNEVIDILHLRKLAWRAPKWWFGKGNSL